jgi:polysaccharide export outer membrane protein
MTFGTTRGFHETANSPAKMPCFPGAPRLTHGVVVLLWVGLVLSACASQPPFVWATSLPADPPLRSADTRDEALRPGDTLAVVVAGHEQLTSNPVVSNDGFVVLPGIGTLPVMGERPSAVRAEVTSLVAKNIEAPQVSVVVISRRLEVSVLGEVTTPGKYVIETQDGVANALALAGGLTEFADDDGIYLVREGRSERIRFRMRDLVSGGGTRIRLHDHDLIVVE